MGAETEYGFSGSDASLEQFFRVARARLDYLPGLQSPGVYLSNGSRLYQDSSHPEYASPEVDCPYLLVSSLEAGDRVIEQLLGKRARSFVWKGNVDYLAHCTWGSHESYQYTQTPSGDLARRLVPFLVSRLITTGAGGFISDHPGIVFSISPRVWYLTEVVSPNSTRDRPIVHTRDEALCAGGFHRFHLICGESLQSQKGNVLRFGSTALVIALIEAGVNIGEPVQLADPLAAMRAFALDPTCRATARSSNGRLLTALDIQNHYFATIAEHLHEPFIPDWASSLCDLWRRILFKLVQGASGVELELDWSIKLAMLKGHANSRGIPWGSLQRWNVALEMLEHLGETQATTVPTVVERYLKNHGLSSEQLPLVLALRNELFEIDVRYSALQDKGLFRLLDAGGVLDHRVERVPDPTRLMTSPPGGRAGVRGNWIKRLSTDKSHRYSAEWQGIWDRCSKKWLDLTDPYVTAVEEWQPVDNAKMAAAGLRQLPGPSQGALIARVWDYYRGGALRRVARLLESLLGPSGSQSMEMLRLSSWVRARLGFADGHEILDRLYAERSVTGDCCCDYLQVFRYSYLQPDSSRMEPWIAKGQQILAAGTPPTPTRVVFKEYSAGHWMKIGALEKAQQWLTEALDEERSGIDDSRIVARIQCDLAEVQRRLGNINGASENLRQARRIQLLSQYLGDYANYNLTCRAKLLEDKSLAVATLRRAKAIQHRLGDSFGLARTLLLECRLRSDQKKAPTFRRALDRLKGLLPALQQCPTYANIIIQWDEWTCNPASVDGDRFWGV